MKKATATLALVVILATLSWADTAKEKADERLQNAGKVLQEILNAPDKGIPEEVIKGAKCIAVIPHEIRAGFIFGARSGKGVATCRTANGWSAPSFFTITGGSWGAQIGIEGIDNVLMIMNDKGMQHLLSNKFQIGAQASAAAGPVGRHAAAGTDWKLETEILSYSRSKRCFCGRHSGWSLYTPRHRSDASSLWRQCECASRSVGTSSPSTRRAPVLSRGSRRGASGQ